MTELGKMQRAKMYIDKLANGVDPITDMEMQNDTILNNVRIHGSLNDLILTQFKSQTL